MSSPLKISEETLVECSFGDYMIRVDDCLEILIGRSTTQTELDSLADLQESDYTPHEAAWVIAKESFPRKRSDRQFHHC